MLAGHLQTTGTNDTFHLGDLSLPASHNVCEFDGSLSRGDLALGDASHFDIGTWYKTGSRLGLYDLNYDHKHVFNTENGTNPGPTAYVSVETAARAWSAHHAEDMAANKDFTVGVVNGSVGTTAFYLFTLWDDVTQSVPKSWVRSFFGKHTELSPHFRHGKQRKTSQRKVVSANDDYFFDHGQRRNVFRTLGASRRRAPRRGVIICWSSSTRSTRSGREDNKRKAGFGQFGAFSRVIQSNTGASPNWDSLPQ